jgi:hypothetical protein
VPVWTTVPIALFATASTPIAAPVSAPVSSPVSTRFLVTVPGTASAGVVRERPAPATQVPETREGLAAELLVAFSEHRRGEARIRRAEARCLAFLRERNAHRERGFASFGDFAREILEIAPRTVQARIALHRALAAFPVLETAFLEGRLTACQIAVLRPVLKETNVSAWVEEAKGRSVRGLQRRVAQAVRGDPGDPRDLGDRGDRGAQADRAEADLPEIPETSLPGNPETSLPGIPEVNLPAIAAADPPGRTVADPPGRTVRFSVPEPVRLAWEQALDLSRRVLGWDAPRHLCFEAMLAEVSAETAPAAPELGLFDPQRLEETRDWRRHQLADIRSKLYDPAPSRAVGVSSSSPTGAPRQPTLESSPKPLESPGGGSPCGSRHGSPLSSPPGSPLASDPRPQPDAPPRPPRPRVPWLAPETRERLFAETRRTLGCLYRELTDLEELADGSGPASVDEAIDRLEALRLTDRPLCVLFARLLRLFRDLGAAPILGFASATEFATGCLGLSERTVRSRQSEADLFEDEPRLEEAFISGRIGLGKAMLIRRLRPRTAAEIEAFIRRAAAVTHRQFAREVRFLEKLADCWGTLSHVHPGPLPLPGLEEDLRRRLCEVGWTEPTLAEELRRRGLEAPAVPSGKRWRAGEAEFAADRGRRSGADPVTGPPADPAENPPAGPAENPEAEPAERPGTNLVTDPADNSVPDPAGNPILMRRLEVLLDLLILSVHEDALKLGDEVSPTGRLTASPELPRVRISFWAPESTIESWEGFRDEVRRRFGALPDWAVLTLLLREATEEWLRVDPESKPTEGKTLERDGYRCQAPGCTARRNLEVHHIVYRSAGGGEEPENRTVLCHRHHRLIHDGVVVLKGRAPGDLRWRLGRQRPEARFHGDRRIPRGCA